MDLTLSQMRSLGLRLRYTTSGAYSFRDALARVAALAARTPEGT
jgi:hypothetical protein